MNRQQIFSKIPQIPESDVLDHSQFILDFFEILQDRLHDETLDIDDFIGATKYEIRNILEIINPSKIADIRILNETLSTLKKVTPKGSGKSLRSLSEVSQDFGVAYIEINNSSHE